MAGRWWDDKAGHCLGRQMAGGFSKAAGIGAEDEEEEEGAQLLSCSHVHLQHGCCFRRIGTFPSMELTPHANPRAQGGKKKKINLFATLFHEALMRVTLQGIQQMTLFPLQLFFFQELFCI